MGAELSTDKKKRQRAEYVARINRVMDYIEEHIDKDLSLEALAKVACFSPCHFHRVFAAMTGETLNRYVRRLRVEKAASQLLANPSKSVTEIALDCGFSSPSVFSRTFKEIFGFTAVEWQGMPEEERNLCKEDRKIGKAYRNMGKAEGVSISHSGFMTTSSPTWRIEMEKKQAPNNHLTATVTVEELAPKNVIYARHIGPYAGLGEVFKELFGRLYGFAGPRGLIGPNTESLSVYHDDPMVCEEEKLRTDACITVPEGTKGEGDIGTMVIPGGKFGIARFELAGDQYSAAWDAVIGGWLPESGYQFDDRLSFELYRQGCDDHPENKCKVEICIPIKPL
jgi:AraC family transcriptional regulator